MRKILGADYNSELANNARESTQLEIDVDPRTSRFNLGWVKEWFEQIEALPTALIRDMARNLAK